MRIHTYSVTMLARNLPEILDNLAKGELIQVRKDNDIIFNIVRPILPSGSTERWTPPKTPQKAASNGREAPMSPLPAPVALPKGPPLDIDQWMFNEGIHTDLDDPYNSITAKQVRAAYADYVKDHKAAIEKRNKML